MINRLINNINKLIDRINRHIENIKRLIRSIIIRLINGWRPGWGAGGGLRGAVAPRPDHQWAE